MTLNRKKVHLKSSITLLLSTQASQNGFSMQDVQMDQTKLIDTFDLLEIGFKSSHWVKSGQIMAIIRKWLSPNTTEP